MKILLNEKYCRRKVVQGRREVDVFRREIYPQINVTLCAVLGVPIIVQNPRKQPLRASEYHNVQSDIVSCDSRCYLKRFITMYLIVSPRHIWRRHSTA